MTDRLLLDTHVALWLDSGDERLHASTRALIDGCWLKLACPLVTYDERIARFGARHGRQYRFAVAT